MKLILIPTCLLLAASCTDQPQQDDHSVTRDYAESYTDNSPHLNIDKVFAIEGSTQHYTIQISRNEIPLPDSGNSTLTIRAFEAGTGDTMQFKTIPGYHAGEVERITSDWYLLPVTTDTIAGKGTLYEFVVTSGPNVIIRRLFDYTNTSSWLVNFTDKQVMKLDAGEDSAAHYYQQNITLYDVSGNTIKAAAIGTSKGYYDFQSDAKVVAEFSSREKQLLKKCSWDNFYKERVLPRNF